jgi:hypothetical protein
MLSNWEDEGGRLENSPVGEKVVRLSMIASPEPKTDTYVDKISGDQTSEDEVHALRK